MRRLHREVHSGLSDIISTETCQCRISGEALQKDILLMITRQLLYCIVLYCIEFARDLNLIKSDC